MISLFYTWRVLIWYHMARGLSDCPSNHGEVFPREASFFCIMRRNILFGRAWQTYFRFVLWHSMAVCYTPIFFFTGLVYCTTNVPCAPYARTPNSGKTRVYALSSSESKYHRIFDLPFTNKSTPLY